MPVIGGLRLVYLATVRPDDVSCRPMDTSPPFLGPVNVLLDLIRPVTSTRYHVTTFRPTVWVEHRNSHMIS